MMHTIPQIYQQAVIYDRMFNLQGDVAFFKSLIIGDCLEICCGTGRVLLELAAARVEAHGLDYAASMLDEARKKAADRGLYVNLYEGDMRQFDLGRTFSTVLIAANSVCHLYTLEDIQRHLSSVQRHTRPDSQYIIDVFTPRLDLLLQEDRHHILDFVDPADNQPVAVYEESHYDSATQIKHNQWFYEKAGETKPAVDLPMRMFFPQELDALLTLNGFQIVDKLGNYDGAAFKDGSPHQIIICKPH